MKKLAEQFKKIAIDLGILRDDITKIIGSKKEELEKLSEDPEQDLPKEENSFRSLQKMTYIRKTKEDLVKAEEDPEITFINDKLNDIFE